MINAVKRISNKPPEEIETGTNTVTTIYEEIDRFLVALYKTALFPSQIYYIDRLLQSYSSNFYLQKAFAPVIDDNLFALDDTKYIQLLDVVKTTKTLHDTSNKFKDHLIQMLANIDTHRRKTKGVKVDIRPQGQGRVITVPNRAEIIRKIGSTPYVSPSVAPGAAPGGPTGAAGAAPGGPTGTAGTGGPAGTAGTPE